MSNSAPSVVIIGAGFGGFSAARALRERGIADITILERADEVGGVWRDNTYPNAACDVPSVLYSWSFAPKPDWSRRYGTQPEILDYLTSTAEQLGLRELVRTGVTVTRAEHDGRSWQIWSEDGRRFRAEVLISAVGQLSEPVHPQIAGTFGGISFHSAQWRHDVDLAGKRVAVIGTGASAIQFVPGIVDEAAAVTVFQRSAPYVVPKPDQAYSERHHRTFERRPGVMNAERRLWFWLTERFNAALTGQSRASRPFLATVRAAWQAHLRHHIKDAGLRRRLTPDYPIGCKRVLFSNDWYPALAREHVDVVIDRIAELTADGVRTADGREYPADVLIWGTGFAATEFLRGIEVVNANGVSLHQQWRTSGTQAYLGVAVTGFANLFCIYGPNTNLGGSSIINMLEAQADYVAQAVVAFAEGDGRPLSVRSEAAQRFDVETQRRLGASVWASCDSWYAEGDRVSTNWPGLVAEYQARLARFDPADYAPNR